MTRYEIEAAISEVIEREWGTKPQTIQPIDCEIFRAGLLAAASIAQENDDTGTGMGDAIAKAIRAAAGEKE